MNNEARAITQLLMLADFHGNVNVPCICDSSLHLPAMVCSYYNPYALRFTDFAVISQSKQPNLFSLLNLITGCVNKRQDTARAEPRVPALGVRLIN